MPSTRSRAVPEDKSSETQRRNQKGKCQNHPDIEAYGTKGMGWGLRLKLDAAKAIEVNEDIAEYHTTERTNSDYWDNVEPGSSVLLCAASCRLTPHLSQTHSIHATTKSR